MKKVALTVCIAGALAWPTFALAQSEGGVAGGAAAGAVGGAIVGGPVGAVVGGAAGAIVGGVAGSLTEPDVAYARSYVVRHPQPRVRYQGNVVVGAQIPEGVQLYAVEGRPELRGYYYTYLNEQPVLVQNRRVVHVIR